VLARAGQLQRSEGLMILAVVEGSGARFVRWVLSMCTKWMASGWADGDVGARSFLLPHILVLCKMTINE
jgi:hypothetical protein